MDTKRIATIISILIGLTVLIGTLYKLDIKWDQTMAVAKVQQDIIGIDKRLNNKILEDQLFNIQERMWKIKDRYGEEIEDYPQEVKDEYRNLEREYDRIKEKIKKIEEEKKETG